MCKVPLPGIRKYFVNIVYIGTWSGPFKIISAHKVLVETEVPLLALAQHQAGAVRVGLGGCARISLFLGTGLEALGNRTCWALGLPGPPLPGATGSWQVGFPIGTPLLSPGPFPASEQWPQLGCR